MAAISDDNEDALEMELSEEESKFFSEILRKVAEVVKTLEIKGKDYSGMFDLPIANYIYSAEFAGITPVQGMFARLSEKFMRMSNIVKRGGKVMDETETIEETLKDIIGISLLLWQHIDENGKETKEPENNFSFIRNIFK